MRLSLALAAIALSLTLESMAVAQRNDKPDVVPSDDSGEVTAAQIDNLANDAKITGERLFVIARLGTGETSQRLNYGRLFNTRNNIAPKPFDQSSIVFASGDRVVGEGRIEFYLGSRLRLVVLAKRNKMPNLTCCRDYLPPRRKHRH